jgi:hypothetical protein
MISIFGSGQRRVEGGVKVVVQKNRNIFRLFCCNSSRDQTILRGTLEERETQTKIS